MSPNSISREKIFLSVLLGLFNREVALIPLIIVSFKLVQDMMAKDALNTFDDCQRLFDPLDQGWQYHHKEYVKLLHH